MTDKNIEMAYMIGRAVQQAGGRTYFVGGYVRDLLLGRDSKDIDIEVHGVSVQDLEKILDTLGERLTMGASFGIMGLRNYELDIAMPRSETATGRGHKDFEIFVDPFIGEEKAAVRRDFTINALMQDVLTGEILDFFGGRDDILHQNIRHINDQTFVEDPLRVLRAAQLLRGLALKLPKKHRHFLPGWISLRFRENVFCWNWRKPCSKRLDHRCFSKNYGKWVNYLIGFPSWKT